MIKKILIANRGEIASRVIRTCANMGISSVAVYSDPDSNSQFVFEADEAVPLGGASPVESYLRADAIIEAARKTGADAIHPGYGFLSENAEFAEQCEAAGITFIGPTPHAIRMMGSKLTARELMEDAGVPVLPGRDLSEVNSRDALAYAEEIGWPVLVKASFGGGGRGMRVVREPAELIEAIDSARREAGSAFGNDTVFLEHYVDEPRHIEIQIFGDQFGRVEHLNERECSIQRRHQKIIEESPSPAVNAQLREQMGQAAIKAGEALNYVGAGTVEFLLAPDGRFYFLEVNTRLQVEHPVTEMVTGLDLVRLQIEVANGIPLPSEVAQPAITGHAIEARLYAEDVAQDFLPAAGPLRLFEVPELPGIRVDAGVRSGDNVSTNYDPMLAKIIAHGTTRSEAINRLSSALRQTRIAGIETNRTLLVGILEEQEFSSGNVDTHYLQRMPLADLVTAGNVSDFSHAALAAALVDQASNRAGAKKLATIPSGFRNNHATTQVRRFVIGGNECLVNYRLHPTPEFKVDDTSIDVVVEAVTPEKADIVIDGIRRTFYVRRIEDTYVVSEPRGTITLTRVPRFPDPDDRVEPGSLTAPMPGTVTQVAVQPGDFVTEGQTLLVLEAMKMEHPVRAIANGVVTDISVTVGSPVDNGQVLVVCSERVQEEVPV
jgi:acetyl-CoA carboxylase biotin carboxylase subunit